MDASGDAICATLSQEIAHIPGVTNTAADALSRVACPAIVVKDDW